MKNKYIWKEMNLNIDFWSDGLLQPCYTLQKIANSMWKEKFGPRYKWTEDQLKRLIPKWQAKLMLRGRNEFLVNLFGWRVDTTKLSENKTRMSIYHYKKLIISKTFNEKQ